MKFLSRFIIYGVHNHMVMDMIFVTMSGDYNLISLEIFRKFNIYFVCDLGSNIVIGTE